MAASQAPGIIAGGDEGTDVVDVRQVVKRFDGTHQPALDGVDLQVRSGEMVAIIGLSGSGKSTLLRHLNGLQQPTSGEVHVLGHQVDRCRGRELRALRRDVGMVFQAFHLVGRLSALENVLTGAFGRLRGPRYGVLSYGRDLRREALAQLERVGLADQAFQRADTLSGGQQQRVAIARALFQRPRIVLADEPVASLDPEASEGVMQVLVDVCREDGLTVLCSLHQVELALGWADRLVGLRDGRVVFDRPAAGLSSDEVRAVYKRVEPSNETAANGSDDT